MLSWILLLSLTTAKAQYWTVTGSLTSARASHTATQLPNGNVLVAAGYNGGYLNSAELYNVSTGAWNVTGSLTYPRAYHTATQLPNGNVLVAGGYDGGYLNSAELYKPTTGVWTAAGNLAHSRAYHTDTQLPNGNVLVAGGSGYVGYPNSAELYSATSGVWTVTGSLTYAREQHTAALLPNGNVLVAGGYDSGYLSSAELYYATTSVWTVTGSLTYSRAYHTATQLPNGNVLVVGGFNGTYMNIAELYNVTTGVWTVTGSLTYARAQHTATLLANGNVLVVGGTSSIDLNTAELYNAITGIWTLTGSLTYARNYHTATPFSNETVLVAGGYDASDYLSSSELYSSSLRSTVNVGVIAGGIIGGLVGLVLLVLLLWFIRARYSRNKDANSTDYRNPIIGLTSVESKPSQVLDVSRAQSVESNTLRLDRKSEIYIPYDSLKLGVVLGQGHFGQVYQANYTGAQVAVKKSKGIDEKLILEEATLMKNIPLHPNVLYYYGVSQENGEFMMVIELCDKGNLLQYLRRANYDDNLSLQQFHQFCRQIASGMWHVSKHGIIHRDLRAENILLSSTETTLVAKVADFGLARSLDSHNDEDDSAYYRMTELKEIPVAWTPPEVLNPTDQFKYIAASDVWSFGVVMWEIYSRGAKPFDGVTVQLTIATIRDDIRTIPLLPRPNNCPDDIFSIINSCWAFNPKDRPSFEQLYNQLS